MGHNYNQLNLPPSNGPKITHRILLCKPYSTRHRSHPYPDTLKLHRSNRPYDCPRPHILHTFLSSKLKLRTNPQPNHNSSSRPTNAPSTNSHLMTTSKSNQLSSTPNNQLNWRTICSNVNLFMI